MRMNRCAALLPVCLAFLTSFALAQDAKPPLLPATQPSLRDPTEPDAALKQALDGTHPVSGNHPRTGVTPVIINRGLVLMEGKPPEALIEVPGHIEFFIREGSVFNAGTGNEDTTMRVIRLSADGIELEVEVASRKQRITLR